MRSPPPLRLESFHAQIGHANCALEGKEGDEWRIERKGPDRPIVVSYARMDLLPCRRLTLCVFASRVEIAIGEPRLDGRILRLRVRVCQSEGTFCL